MKKLQKPARSIFSHTKYFGKHVLIAKGRVYAVRSAREASSIFDKLVAKGVVPTVTFVPKNQSLILSWR